MRISIVATTLLFALLFSGQSIAQHTCNDGSYSGSNGSGTCSHHGGESDNDH